VKGFARVVVAVLAATVLHGCCAVCCEEVKEDAAVDDQLGWRLSMQAYTFHKGTFFEAVDKTASLGLKYIEMFPGQRISEDDSATTDFDMSTATRLKVKEKLRDAGLELVNYGVVGAGDEAGWRSLFEFAKDMGIETIVTEPSPEHMDLVEELCDEFKINVAIHNHPKPSHYWNPDTVLKAVEGRSKRMGACADTGHWMRSGLDPIECLKKLEGRIVSLHFKDLNESGREGHDVPWGTGAGNAYGMLAEIKRQGFRGVFSIEYEYNWNNSVPEIRECAKYFRLIAAALAEEGYEPLFKEDLSDAIMSQGGWAVDGGVLAAEGEGDIWTKKRYADFVLDLEFKCDPETNSGVFLRCKSIEEWMHTAIEVQILQPAVDNPTENCGAIFDCLGPTKKMVKKAGEWNHYIIIAKANRIYVILNGEQVIDMDLDLWTEPHKNPDGTPNKFNYAYRDMSREGHVGLQYHGHPVWFRNLRIKPL